MVQNKIELVIRIFPINLDCIQFNRVSIFFLFLSYIHIYIVLYSYTTRSNTHDTHHNK